MQFHVVPLLMALLAIGTFAQNNPRQERVKELNAEVLELYSTMHEVSSGQLTASTSQSLALFDQRLAALEDLIEHDPQQTLLVAFSPDLLAEMVETLPLLKSKLESHGEWQGRIDQLVEDGPKLASSKVVVQMVSGKDRPFLNFASQSRQFRSGDVLTVRGIRAGDHIAVEQAQLVTAASPSPTLSNTGGQNVAVILVNLKDYQLPPGTDTAVRSIILGNSAGGPPNTPDWSVDQFLQKNSYGQTWVTQSNPGALTVVGPVALSQNYNSGGSCEYEALLHDAYEAANPHLDEQNYSRFIFVVNDNGGSCDWDALASVGIRYWCESPLGHLGPCTWAFQKSAPLVASRFDGVRALTHVLGHNFGMGHARSRAFDTEPLGPPDELGTMLEDGDHFSVMGGNNIGFYNAGNALSTSWLHSDQWNPDEQFFYHYVEQSGSYSIQALEDQTPGIKALMIRRFKPGMPHYGTLVVEFRQNVGIFDSTLNPQVFTGALIHYSDSLTDSNTDLLDFTPQSANGFADPALAVGKTWTDPYTGLRIKADSIVNGKLNLTVTYGEIPGCTRAKPAVTISPSNPSIPVDMEATYTIKVTNRDSASCGASYFRVYSTLPVGWRTYIDPLELALDPGASATAQVYKSPVPTTTLGTYTVEVRVRNEVSGVNTKVTASCTVTPRIKPGLPKLASPPSGAKGVSLNPTLSWTGLRADTYEVRLGTTYPTPFYADTTQPSINPGPLAPHTKYFWKVISRNRYGYNASQVWVFTTQTAGPPLPPTWSKPHDKDDGAELNLLLIWLGGLGATSYDLYFGPTPTPPLLKSDIGSNRYMVGPLKTGTWYYWRIVSKNGPDSSSTTVWSVKTKLAPDRPLNPSPANGATQISRTPTLQWDASVGATSYLVYFGTDATPPQVATVTKPTFKPAGTLVPNTKYYWRLAALSATGTAMSQTWSFWTQ